MTRIRFNCDRCGAPVEGVYTHAATAGFYVVDASGSPWARFGRPGEHLVCDECIQSMPEYQAEHGRRRGRAEITD